LNSWVRASTSALLCCAALACARAESFGRFGWGTVPVAPGFRFDASGFASDTATSDWLRFERAMPEWRPEGLSERGAKFVPAGSGPVRAVESDLRSPGFVLERSGPLRLACSALAAPLLSVPEATFGPGVDAPAARWLLLTLDHGQPALLASGLDGELLAGVEGSPGQWRIVLSGAKRIRFCLPAGVRPLPDRTAGTLGRLASRIRGEEDRWCSEAPRLVGLDLREEPDAVVAVWRFDARWAVIPPAVLLAKEAGVPIEVLSAAEPADAPMPDGPTAFSWEPRIAIKFPLKRPGVGRAVVSGLSASLAGGATELQAVLGGLFLGPFGAAERRAVRDSVLARMRKADHPATGVPVGYDASGDGAMDTALLALVRRLADDSADAANPSRNELLWTLDPASFRLWLPSDEAAEAGVLLALCLALEPSPRRSLESAMLASGTVARWQLPKYRAKHGIVAGPEPVAGMLPVARFLAGMPESDPWLRALSSPLRCVAGPAEASFGADGRLEWLGSKGRPQAFGFLTPKPVEAAAGANVSAVSATGTGEYLEVVATPASDGPASLLLKMPRSDRLVPRWPGWPKWLPRPR
jgi:hypothetical protein